jgi:hypothetical protein
MSINDLSSPVSSNSILILFIEYLLEKCFTQYSFFLHTIPPTKRSPRIMISRNAECLKQHR